MPPSARPSSFAAQALHPLQWLWEPMERQPSFVLKAMFGAQAAYLDGRLYFCFCARGEAWNGVLVATDRERHAALVRDFPALAPHPVLSKWLYVPQTTEAFEATAVALVRLALRRDPRLGVVPQPKQRRRLQVR